MTAEQRREILREELLALTEIIVNYYSTCPTTQIDNPFIAELEAQMKRKTAELEALNALDTPVNRFRAACRDSLLVIWIAAVFSCIAAVFFCYLMSPWISVPFAVCAVLSLIWAIWAGAAPRT